MASDILIEGCNLTLPEGTGIATYARNLNNAVRTSGWTTDVLIDVNKPLDKADPVLNEILVFDAPAAGLPRPPFLQRLAKSICGTRFGIAATNVPLAGTVAESAAALSGFDAVYAATNLHLLARKHFERYNDRAWIKLEKAPALFHATQAIAIGVKGCANIYTVHDIVPLRLPTTTLDNKKYFLEMMRHLCRTADHIVTVSEFSRRDIVKFFGMAEDRITNTYQTVQLPSKALALSTDDIASAIEDAFALTHQQYFLFVGALEPKKNLSRLIDAYAASRSKYPLVIVGGSGWQNEDILDKISDERFLSYRIINDTMVPTRQVRHLSYASPDLLPALIRGARALLFPSLFEGFGLPVLEAMILGTPVMTSNVTSLPEVVGDAAILVDPLDVDDMVQAIRKLDSDGDLRAELSARGRRRAELFSPENYRKRVGELYRSILGNGTASVVGR